MPLPRHHNLKDEERKADSFAEHVTQEALANVIILDSSPTSSNGILPEQSLGFDGSNLFITLSGTTYRISLTAV